MRVCVAIGIQLAFVFVGFGAMYVFGATSGELSSTKVFMLAVVGVGFLPLVLAGLVFPICYMRRP